jgi:peptide deformylase
MNLVYHPDPFLDKQVKDVDLENPGFDPKELKQEMIDVMLSNHGIGLSANQVGLDAQVFVFGDSAKNSTICINPTVLQYTEETVLDVEGCLSFPNMYVKVKRPKEILAKWYDENLQEQVVKIEGYSAKCYLHEWDHLQGITFKDRVSKMKWDMALKKAKKIEKQYEALKA